MEVSTKHLLVIDSYDDLVRKLVHPCLMGIDRSGLSSINWKRLAELYNGIWLTARGEAKSENKILLSI